jgi:hypothetical protein
MKAAQTPGAELNLIQMIECAQRALELDDEALATALELKVTTFKCIKAGTLRLPWGKLIQLAEALEIDPALLLEMQLRTTSPELLDVIEQVWAPLNLSAREKNLIRECRRMVGGQSAAPLIFDGRGVIALIIP